MVSTYCSKILVEIQWAAGQHRLFHKAARALGSVLSLCSCSFMVNTELIIDQKSGREGSRVLFCVCGS